MAPLTEAGREWIVDASGIEPAILRDLARVQSVVARLIEEAGLSPLGAPQWHVFGGEAGLTGLVMLAESHVAVHTFPELGLATFNLYCCRPRPEWPFRERLEEMLGARDVSVRTFDRGVVASRREAAE